MFKRTLAGLGLLTALSTPAMADAGLDKRVEEAIVETIKMTSSGDVDAWIAKYCDPKRCHDQAAKNDMKSYQLKSAQNFSKACLVGESSVTVKQKKGDVSKDADGALWYLKCEGRQLGVPVRMRFDAEADRIWFVQLGF